MLTLAEKCPRYVFVIGRARKEPLGRGTGSFPSVCCSREQQKLLTAKRSPLFRLVKPGNGMPKLSARPSKVKDPLALHC